MSMACGHCGSEVKAGFTVCSGCGAHYRMNRRMIGPSIFIGLVGLVLLVDQPLAGILALGVAAAGFYFGTQKKWFRHNA